jgi:hypothetical protein
VVTGADGAGAGVGVGTGAGAGVVGDFGDVGVVGAV